MSPRRALPGADELFRTTGTTAAPTADLTPSVSDLTAARPLSPVPETEPAGTSSRGVVRAPVRRSSSGQRRPTGRQRHEEKITVYVSPEELVDLEHARLALRADHGLAVDRGRIVREALSVVLADLEAKGDTSILVRRLRGR